MIRRLIPVFILVVGLVGCKKGTRFPVTHTLSTEPIFEIVNVKPDEQLGIIVSAKQSKDGKYIAVLEFTKGRIALYDGEGNFIREFGRPGVEAGELLLRGGMGSTEVEWGPGDRIYVLESGLRVQIFDTLGNSERIIPLPDKSAISMAVHPHTGNIYVTFGPLSTIRVAVISPMGDELIRVTRDEPMQLDDILRGKLWDMINAYEYVAVDDDGNFYVLRIGDARIEQYDASGDLLKSITLDIRRVRLTKTQIDSMLMGISEEQRALLGTPQIPMGFGVFYNDGNLWVGLNEYYKGKACRTFGIIKAADLSPVTRILLDTTIATSYGSIANPQRGAGVYDVVGDHIVMVEPTQRIELEGKSPEEIQQAMLEMTYKVVTLKYGW